MTKTLKQAKTILAEIGATITKRDGEFRVNGKDWPETRAYYTTDIDDASAPGCT
jgi:hypothetical protein